MGKLRTGNRYEQADYEPTHIPEPAQGIQFTEKATTNERSPALTTVFNGTINEELRALLARKVEGQNIE